LFCPPVLQFHRRKKEEIKWKSLHFSLFETKVAT
jgi:hypothetical protein